MEELLVNPWAVYSAIITGVLIGVVAAAVSLIKAYINAWH